MITETIITFLVSPILALLDLIEISISIPDGVLNGFTNLFSSVYWVFPVNAILPILGFKMVVRVAQFTFALIVRIKSFIPTMGN